MAPRRRESGRESAWLIGGRRRRGSRPVAALPPVSSRRCRLDTAVRSRGVSQWHSHSRGWRSWLLQAVSSRRVQMRVQSGVLTSSAAGRRRRQPGADSVDLLLRHPRFARSTRATPYKETGAPLARDGTLPFYRDVIRKSPARSSAPIRRSTSARRVSSPSQAASRNRPRSFGGRCNAAS